MKTAFSFLWIVFLAVLIVACKKENSHIEWDFDPISEKGELTAITLSSSVSYFIYKGEPMGYEYELLKNFADAHHLKLNIKIAENMDQLNTMLGAGEGDLIAYNIPITIEGKDSLLYCGREVINEQVLIQRANKGDTILKDVTEMIGKEVWVVKGSKYYNRLVNLNDELGGGIRIRTIEKDTVSVEDLIDMVSDGKIVYTVSDKNMAQLNKTYHPNININLKISHPQRSAWAVRKTSPELAKVLNEWFRSYQKNPTYRSTMKRYFEMSKMESDEPEPELAPGKISRFDLIFKKYAPQIGWDWRLLASLSYQESRFQTDRTSWAGATGLMGLMPQTATNFGLPPDQRTDPEGSVKAGVKYIQALNKIFASNENKEERIKFVLAAYNAGIGHIYDAQALTRKYGKNPDIWDGNVEEYLKLKSLPEYYNDEVCKQGYFRSSETISYVHRVLERWNHYKEKVK